MINTLIGKWIPVQVNVKMTIIILLDDNINSVDIDWFVHYYIINIFNISILVFVFDYTMYNVHPYNIYIWGLYMENVVYVRNNEYK